MKDENGRRHVWPRFHDLRHTFATNLLLGGVDLATGLGSIDGEKLVKRWTPFAGHILGKQTLPFRDRELLILRIGWLNEAEYEFAQHELIARRGGMSDEDIARLKEGPKAKGWSEHESALLQVADDLHENSVVSDATWAALSKKYSTEQLMDAVFTVGQYNLVSWALNSFGVPLDDFLPGAKK